MKISCIAVDDEPLALDKMEIFIKKVPFLDLKALFSNGIEAMEYINANAEKIDLLFLDIQMDDITGIQLLEVLKNKPKVIFTTAYDQYALKAYDLDVCDYLLKPISFNRFLKGVNKVYDLLCEPSQIKSTEIGASMSEVGKAEHKSNKVDYIFLKTEYRMQKVNFDDILLIQGMKDYLMVKTTKGNIMTLMSFKKMENLLPTDNFIRTHKSYMISINKIESIERNRIKINNELIPISDTYKNDFYNYLKELGVNSLKP